MASAKRLGDTPPVDYASNSVGVAFVWAEGQGYIFYYNQTDQKLYVAEGQENAGYSAKPIAVGQNHENIYFNFNSTPTPLAAGFNSDTKEIRVFYIQAGGQIGELITQDFGKNWKYGALTGQSFSTASPGGLAAYPGNKWRVVIRMKGQEQTLVELYEDAPESWSQYIIP